MNYSLFVSCPKGLEYVLEEELKGLGLNVTRVSPQGVYGEASLAVVYQLCLWSRVANRVQLILFSGQADDDRSIQALSQAYPWETVFASEKSLAIEFHGSSEKIRNTMYGGQVLKDGIADHFRQVGLERPTVDKENPQIRIHSYLKKGELTVSLDLTGYSLHQRGYRSLAGAAPLKENVAAALLLRAKWPELAAKGYDLHDPFCGSATLVIEAAMMAGNRAPGLLRTDQALSHWLGHQPELWESLRQEALAKALTPKIKLSGSDVDSRLIATALKNAEHAGVSDLVAFSAHPVEDSRPLNPKGLLVCNPPYGERLGDVTELVPVYQQLGAMLHEHYQGWDAAVLTSSPLLAKAIGLKAMKQYTLFNGALECKLYCIEVNENNSLKTLSGLKLSGGAEILVNRLKKNVSHLGKWARKNGISCYRLYDADLPEYAFAIDIYNDHVVVQEYKAPASIAAHKVEKRSLEVIQAIPVALGIDPGKIVVKLRQKQKGDQQYQKLNQSKKTMVVQEGKARIQVNLYDYLDTGLFLDHRPLRLQFEQLAPGTRFLNCFCYTATASLHAALAGAITTNVDLSKTYLRWAEDNFNLNQLDCSRHQFVHYDCLEWMAICRDRFDVIFLDPPSFSNSKRMSQTLDVQRDQLALIDAAMKLLKPNGRLYFSTNFRQFKLDPLVSSQYQVKDISAQTIDLDFKRNQRIHQCFVLTMR